MVSRRLTVRHQPGGNDGHALCGALTPNAWAVNGHPATCTKCLTHVRNPDWPRACRGCGVAFKAPPAPGPVPGMHPGCGRRYLHMQRDFASMAGPGGR